MSFKDIGGKVIIHVYGFNIETHNTKQSITSLKYSAWKYLLI